MLRIIFFKILLIPILLFSSVSESESVKNDSLLTMTKLYDFCKKNIMTPSVEIFESIYWLPSGYSLNTSRSIKEGKIIYSNYCGAYQTYFENFFNDGTIYSLPSIEIGKIGECGICTENEINKLKSTVKKLDKATKKFSDFTMNEISVAYDDVERYSFIVLYDKEKYMRFFDVNIKVVEKGILLYEKLKDEKKLTQ